MYVYIAKINDVIRYIGVGSKDRYKHVSSGISGCYDLNKAHFNGEEIEVEIFKDGLTREECLGIERDLINQHKNTVFNKVLPPHDMEYLPLEDMRTTFERLPKNTMFQVSKLKTIFKDSFIASNFTSGNLTRISQGVYSKGDIETLDVESTLKFNDVLANFYNGQVRYYGGSSYHKTIVALLEGYVDVKYLDLLWEDKSQVKLCKVQKFIEDVFISKMDNYNVPVDHTVLTKQLIIDNIDIFNNIKSLEIKTICAAIIYNFLAIDISLYGIQLLRGKRSIAVDGYFDKKFNITVPSNLYVCINK